jgi:hypothetical protein
VKRFLKYLGLVIAIAAGLFYVVANHSIADEYQIVCKGQYFLKGKVIDEGKVFFKFQKFRWWVHLWSDSDGQGFVENKGGYIHHLSDLEILDGWGDIVFDKYGGMKKGRYSAMSKTMRYVYGNQLFEGQCAEQTREED